jgi:hypothetical protein
LTSERLPFAWIRQCVLSQLDGPELYARHRRLEVPT